MSNKKEDKQYIVTQNFEDGFYWEDESENKITVCEWGFMKCVFEQNLFYRGT